jgi:SAM-dependent methyltransferase
MSVPKEFKPNISASYYITRHLLFEAMCENVWVLQQRVLDFGAGSSPYRSLIHCDEYIRVDFDSKGHPHDKEEKAIMYDGKRIPFRDGYFHSILATEVLEHIFNLEEILQELHRVLRHRGVILITKPFMCATHEIPNDCSRYTEYGIRYLLEKNGFEIITYRKIGTSIQSQMQMFMSYLDSYVICKFNKLKLYNVVAPVVFTFLNLWCMFLNWLLPAKYNSFLGHVIVAIKK